MSWLKVLGSVTGIAEKWMEDRRGRVRIKIKNLKSKKKELMKKKMTLKLSEKLVKIEKKIKKLQDYLEMK